MLFHALLGTRSHVRVLLILGPARWMYGRARFFLGRALDAGPMPGRSRYMPILFCYC